MTPDARAVALGHVFRQPQLLHQALTHRSFAAEHNERLEFIGDGVLNCAIALMLYERFPQMPEGDLSRMRSSLVNRDTLYRHAAALDLGASIRLGEGELKSGGFARPSILADALEALIGAIFLDGGFAAVRGTIARLYEPLLAGLDPKTLEKDPKTLLQELLQARKVALPQYSVVATRGAAHSQNFEVECLIPELSVRTTGSGSSRRAAEQEAALRAFEQIRR